MDTATAATTPAATPTAPDTKATIERGATRPPVGLVRYADLPEQLRSLDRWLLWKYANVGGRWTKVPIHPRWIGGRLRFLPASSTDAATWLPFADAVEVLALFEHTDAVGLGFVATAADRLTAVDLDDCRDRQAGTLAPDAAEIIRQLDTYTEVSPSGTGIKAFLLGTKPGERCRRAGLHVELYDGKRFLAMTGRRVPGTPADVEPREQQLHALYWRMFPELIENGRKPFSSAEGGAAAAALRKVTLSLTDAEVVERASQARNGARFDALWRGDASFYGGDRSSADFGLASSLAFWVGPDAPRIIALMRQSGLARPKWDRADYLARTVQRAIAGCTSFYGDGSPFTDAIDRELLAAGIDISKLTFESAAPSRPFVPTPAPTAEPRESLAAHADSTAAHPESIAATARLLAARHAELPAPGAGQAAFRTILHSPQLADLHAEEQAAAQRIAAARRDFDRFPCCRRKIVANGVKGTFNLRVRELRCQNRECLGCRAYLVSQETQNAQLRFSSAELTGRQLYELYVPNDEKAWGAFRKAVHRSDGEYFAVLDPLRDAYRVITTAALHNAVALSAADAVAHVTITLNLHTRNIADQRLIRTTHAWKKPQPQKAPPCDEFRLGVCDPSLTPKIIYEIAEGCGTTATPIRPRPGTSMRVYRCWGMNAWSDAMRQRLLDSLFAGELLPDIGSRWTGDSDEAADADSIYCRPPIADSGFSSISNDLDLAFT